MSTLEIVVLSTVMSIIFLSFIYVIADLSFRVRQNEARDEILRGFSEKTEKRLEKAIDRLPSYVVEETFQIVPYPNFFNGEYKFVTSSREIKYSDYTTNYAKNNKLHEVTEDTLIVGKKYVQLTFYKGLDEYTMYYYLGDVEQVKDETACKEQTIDEEPSEPLQTGGTTISAMEGE